MANIIECDGCGIRIGDAGGQRPLGMSGYTTGAYGLPAGDFHWCRGCAAIASKAVYASRPTDAATEEECIRTGLAEAMKHPGRTVTVS